MPLGAGTGWLPTARMVRLSFALNSSTSCLIASIELRQSSTTSLIVLYTSFAEASWALIRLSSQSEQDELVMPLLVCSRALTHWTKGYMALSSSLNLSSSHTISIPSLAPVRSLTLSSKASSSLRCLLIASIFWVLLTILASFSGSFKAFQRLL